MCGKIFSRTAVAVSSAWTWSTITANGWLATPTRVVDKGEISPWLNAKAEPADVGLVQGEVSGLSALPAAVAYFKISLNLQWFGNHSKWWSTQSASSEVQVVLVLKKKTTKKHAHREKKSRQLRMSDKPPVGRKEGFHSQSPLTGRNCPQTWNQLA